MSLSLHLGGKKPRYTQRMRHAGLRDNLGASEERKICASRESNIESAIVTLLYIVT